LKRFILDCEPDKNNIIRLRGDDYRYLAKSRRLAAGEFFPAVLPGGGNVRVQVQSIDGGVLVGKCSTEAAMNTAGQDSPLPNIILFQAMPKGEKMDLIVRQAAEGALTEIVPFVSEFSIYKMNNRTGGKVSRWERIIKEARQQSGSTAVTSVRPPLKMDELFSYWEELKRKTPGTIGLLFHHLPLAKSTLHDYLKNVPPIVVIAVGPEGGFSGSEAERFMEAGFMPLTIGDTIMRTETASLYCAAAVRIILLERDSWELK